MPTIRLVPSEWRGTNTNVSVSNASNMYNNTDNTSYATLTHSTVGTGALYVFIQGFNFADVPANAVVTDFTVKIKGYEYRTTTSTSYAPRLDGTGSGNSPIAGTTATSNFGASTSIITIPTGSLTWSDLVNYGSKLAIRVSLKRTNKNNQCYVYIYGAEIEVTYTLPTPQTDTMYIKLNGQYVTATAVYKKVNGAWVEQTDLQNVFDIGTQYHTDI